MSTKTLATTTTIITTTTTTTKITSAVETESHRPPQR